MRLVPSFFCSAAESVFSEQGFAGSYMFYCAPFVSLVFVVLVISKFHFLANGSL